MNSLNQVKQLIPSDFAKHCDRDISIFTSSVFGETYSKTFRELFGISFTMTIWITRNANQTTFFRSEAEHQNFRKVLGERVLEKEFSSDIILKLRQYTDVMNQSMEENKSLEDFKKHKKEFVDNYRLFFAYHQVIYWPCDYIQEHHPEQKQLINNLTDSYAYSERVVPDVDAYLRRLGIDTQIHSDSLDNTNIAQVFLQDSTITLEGTEAIQLYTHLTSLDKIHTNISELKGLGVAGSKVTGRVHLIQDMSRQHEIKQDEILVTGMTRPQFNPIIRRCKGIITDEGSFLCHASILAREINMPCIVGTKIATKTLNDGDLVELDIINGVIRRLK